MYKGVLDRESQRVEDGVKYFKNTLGPRFIKGALSVFLWRFFLYSRKARKMEMVKWIGTNFIFAQAFERLLDGHATNEQHE